MIGTYRTSRVSLFDNRRTRYTAAQIKKATGADIVLNGSLFNWSDYSPCCDVKIGGKILSDDQWGYYGYGWNDDEMPKVTHSKDMFAVDNFISCLWAIHDGEKVQMAYPSEMGGARGRTAFGFKASGEMVIVCTSDKAPITIEQAQDKLFANGCVSGIILDGGGSSQIDTPDEDITSTRIVSNFVCAWVEKPKQSEPQKGGDTLNIIQPNYKWAYGATIRKKTTHLVLHHVGVVGSFTPEQIHAGHLARGWRGIGYNYYVRKDGTVYRGREENAAGGHTLNYNQVSIGICFEGNFEVEKMPLAQLESGRALIADIKTRYPKIKVFKHKELFATACPGANFPFAAMTAVEQTPTPPAGKIYRVFVPLTQLGAFTDKAKADALVKAYTIKGLKPYITEEKK